MSDVGIIQVPNGNFNESGRLPRWLFHPVGCFQHGDTIAIVEADFAFFDAPTKEESKPNKINYEETPCGLVHGACAAAVLDQASHDLLLSIAKGISLACSCDDSRWSPVWSMRENAKTIVNGYHHVYSRRFIRNNSAGVDPMSRGCILGPDECAFAEAVHLASAQSGMKYDWMNWSWYGVSHNAATSPVPLCADHIEWSKYVCPTARMVHLISAERIYIGDKRGKFIREERFTEL
jgi:hypothetical protein